MEFDTDPAAFNFAGELIIDMGSDVAIGLQTIIATGAHDFSVTGSLSVTGFQLFGAKFENAHIGDNVTVTLIGSNNNLELIGGSIGGSVVVQGSGGDNRVRFSTVISGDVHIDLDGAGDMIDLTGSASAPLHVSGSVYVDLDNDMLGLTGNLDASTARVSGDFVVTGSSGSLNFVSSTVTGHLLVTLSGESSISSANFPVFNQVAGTWSWISPLGTVTEPFVFQRRQRPCRPWKQRRRRSAAQQCPSRQLAVARHGRWQRRGLSSQQLGRRRGGDPGRGG